MTIQQVKDIREHAQNTLDVHPENVDAKDKLALCDALIRDIDRREEWYELEYSAAGADDWYASNEKADTLEGLRNKLKAGRPFAAGFDLRYVKKILTTEVIR